MGLADPAMIARVLLEERQTIATQWSTWLESAETENNELLRQVLEEQFKNE